MTSTVIAGECGRSGWLCLTARVTRDRGLRRLRDTRDALTGLLNRYGLEEAGRVLVGLADRADRPLFAMFVDVGGLTGVNDQHGHPVGDLVLQRTAAAAEDASRSGDLVVRWGGDECLIIGIGDRPQAEQQEARIRSGIDLSGLDHQWSGVLHIGTAAERGTELDELTAAGQPTADQSGPTGPRPGPRSNRDRDMSAFVARSIARLWHDPYVRPRGCRTRRLVACEHGSVRGSRRRRAGPVSVASGSDVGVTLPQRKPATMRDVAARAGVSRSLVSTVFRGVPGAGPETRRRILAAADDLGYRPDDRARRLRSHASSQIGVALTATQRFHVEVTEALHNVAALRGFDLSVALNTGSRTLAHAVDTLLAQRCTALILIGPTAPGDELARLADLAGQIPVIVVDRYSELDSIDTLRLDDEAAYRILIGHLVELGHTDIWHPDGGDYVSAGPRRRAFITAMASYGLADRARILPGGGTAMDGAAAALRLSGGRDLPTAIAGYNDRAACGIIDVLWRHGIRVPDDISVTGIDDIPEASMPHLSITTIEQRPDTLAEAVVCRLMERLDGGAPQGLHLQAPGRLIVRNSTGPVRLAAVASRDVAG